MAKRFGGRIQHGLSIAKGGVKKALPNVRNKIVRGGVGITLGVEVRGARKVIFAMNKYLVHKQSAMYKALQRCLILLEAEMKRLIRKGYYKPAIDTGRMIGSITSEVTEFGTKIIGGRVGTDVFYSYYVHEGKGRHLAPRRFATDALRSKRNEIRLLIRQTIVGKGVTSNLILGTGFQNASGFTTSSTKKTTY